MNVLRSLPSYFLLLGLVLPVAARADTNHNPDATPGGDASLYVPVDEAAGAKYRKVALNGSPLSDEKPQQGAESDEASEETYIDALTMTLRHDTTDIYVPIPASDLFLGVKRTAESEVWRLYKEGLRPDQMKELAFGAGWRSNLGAKIEFYRKVTGVPGEDTATVVDENGQTYRFVVIYHPTASWNASQGKFIGDYNFVPVATSKNDQQVMLSSLTAVNGGQQYVFRRKYGSELTFDALANVQVLELGGLHTYARLAMVKDRYANILDYTYTDNTLIPAKIQHRQPGGNGLAITIQKNSTGCVQSVTDPRGHAVTYGYETFTLDSSSGVVGPSDANAPYHLQRLTSVTFAGNQVTGYEYGFEHEKDLITPFDLGKFYLHQNLTAIVDPLGHRYEFFYKRDYSRQDYSTEAINMQVPEQFITGDGYYPKAGLPMMVYRVELPDNTASMFEAKETVRLSYVVNELKASGQRRNVVTDARGNRHEYQFSDLVVTSMQDFATLYGLRYPDYAAPRTIYYTTMTLRSYEGANTLMGVETFSFSHHAGMALKSTVDHSGNVTQFAHADTFTSTLTPYGTLNAQISGFYGDPTSQTNALLQAKFFTYGANRIMTSSTDEAGTTTAWTVDASGRRLSETITAAGGTRLSETVFDYKDTTGAFLQSGVDYARVSKNFLTKKTVKKLSTVTADPSWVADLVTLYVPDTNGRVTQEVVDMNGNGVIDTGTDLVTTTTYDANGNKLTSTDPRGNVTAFAYDARNRLTLVTYADTTTKQLFYDARGNKTEEIDEKGVATFWRYDALNRVVTQVVDMDGSLKALAAATNHVLADTVTLDRSVHLVTTTTYNALNAKETVTGPKLTETAPGVFRTTVTKFEYDALQRLKKKTDDYGTTSGYLNYITTYDYEPAKNPGGTVFNSSGFKPTKITDPRGYVTEVTYDKLYRPTEEKVEYLTGIFATTFKGYDNVGNLTTVTAPPATVDGVLQTTGTITKTIYDGLRRPTSVTEAFGLTAIEATTTTDYTSTGLAWKTVAEISRTPTVVTRTTTTEYDAAARPVKVFAPAVDDALTPETTLVSPVTETRYDAAGNVSYVINPLGRRTDYAYDTRNRRWKEELPSVTDITTGQASRPTRITGYDDVGNVISVQDARGFIATTDYDNARRPWKVTAPLVTKPDGTTAQPVTTSQYDSAGNVLTLTDANGHVTTNTYDALNRLKTSLQKPDTDPAHDILVQNEYDAAGNRTAVIDGKAQRTEFGYDGLNRNRTIKDPALKLVTFDYDALNKTARIDSENKRTHYLYDARHRLTDVTYHLPATADQLPGVSYADRSVDNRHYDYDLAGQLLSVTEPGKSQKADVAYSYDALGRQLTETSGSLTHTYAYDLANNRVTVTYGGTGTVLTSTYDVLNRLETLSETPSLSSPRVTTYGYDLNGNRAHLQLPNGETTTTTFDALNRQTAIVTTKNGGGSLLELAQAYDLVGNVARITESYPGSTLSGRTVTNTYDRVNRLTDEVTVEGAKTTATAYTFDPANNRTEKAVATTTGSGTTVVETTYAFNDLNQLVGSQLAGAPGTATTYTYDLNGNRQTVGRQLAGASAGTDTYAYDYENRLVSLTVGSQLAGAPAAPGTYAYVYDYRTRRVERTENTTTTKLVFSGGVSVSEYDGAATSSSPPSVEYIRGSDWGGGVGGLLYSVRSGVPSFKHYNSRGDVISETNNAGASTWEGTYEAYGTRTQEVGTTQDRQKANTKEEDPTGLLNEGFRYRDLETGVFITRDPLGFVDGPNMYAYVVQNPWSKFDPNGLQANDNDDPGQAKFDSHIEDQTPSLKALPPQSKAEESKPSQSAKDTIALGNAELREGPSDKMAFLEGAWAKMRYWGNRMLPSDEFGDRYPEVPDPDSGRDYPYLSSYGKGARWMSLGLTLGSFFIGPEAAAENTIARTTLYRAGSHGEFADALSSQILRPGPNSYATGKFFAETAEHAARWGNAMEGAGNFQIMQVEFETSSASRFMRWQKLDGIGPARFGTFEQMAPLKISPLSPP